MQHDRKKISKIIYGYGDSPKVVIDKLEKLVETARIEAVGWAHASACIDMDAGRDPRQRECSGMIDMIETDLQTWEDEHGEEIKEESFKPTHK